MRPTRPLLSDKIDGVQIVAPIRRRQFCGHLPTVTFACAQKGWNVALIARGKEGLEGRDAMWKRLGGHALELPLDVAEADAVFAAADQVMAEWGHIDVWVNDAMVTIFAPIKEIKPDEFRRVSEVTYLGQVYGTMAALKHMRPRNRGTIVQVGSASSYLSQRSRESDCCPPAVCG